jgi:hypothetical protein
MNRLATHLIAVLTAIICFVLLAPTAVAQPSCGDLITTDTTLTADLSGCHGFAALGVQGDVALDLGGHTVSGDAAYGITAFGGQLTIRDGTVSGFGTGVYIVKAGDAYVTRITATHNGYGFDMGHSRAVYERDVATHNLYVGFFAAASSGTSVVASFERNRADWNGQLGIYAPFQTDLGHNKGRHNGDPRQCVGIECKP